MGAISVKRKAANRRREAIEPQDWSRNIVCLVSKIVRRHDKDDAV